MRSEPRAKLRARSMPDKMSVAIGRDQRSRLQLFVFIRACHAGSSRRSLSEDGSLAKEGQFVVRLRSNKLWSLLVDAFAVGHDTC